MWGPASFAIASAMRAAERLDSGDGARARTRTRALPFSFCRMLNAYLRYYNEERPKEKLGWMSPMQYRRSLGLAA